MKNVEPALLACILLAVVSPAKAQVNRSADDIHRKLDRDINVKFKDAILPEFSGIIDGKAMDNAIFRNNVTLLVFWYPYCEKCFDFHKLDTIAATFKADRNFRIIVAGSDTAGLAAFRSDHYMPYPYMALGSEAKMHALNFGNGFTSFVLADKSGRAAKVSLFMNAADYIGYIRETLYR